jgi:hypothetical protein
MEVRAEMALKARAYEEAIPIRCSQSCSQKKAIVKAQRCVPPSLPPPQIAGILYPKRAASLCTGADLALNCG